MISLRKIILALLIFVFMMIACVIEVNSIQKNQSEKTKQYVTITKRSSDEEYVKSITKEPEVVELPQLIYLGQFQLTAYCSCNICCGEYAMDRPIDENGKEIIIGSSGQRLIQGKSIAVDTNTIPFNTKVIINGNEYIAHDTGGAIKGNRIDVYFEDHQEALNFGIRYEDVFILDN